MLERGYTTGSVNGYYISFSVVDIEIFLLESGPKSLLGVLSNLDDRCYCKDEIILALVGGLAVSTVVVTVWIYKRSPVGLEDCRYCLCLTL